MTINKNEIGPTMAVGGENIIHWYGEDKKLLIKSPIGIRIRLEKENFVKEVVYDFPILKKYFKEYLPDTVEIVEGQKDGKAHFDILQTFVIGNVLHKMDLVDEKIKDQLKEIVMQNKNMEKEQNLSWDFFGAWSLFLGNKSVVGNLVITPERKLKMIDIGTMRIKKGNQHWLVYLIIWWAVRRQRKYLAKILNSKY